MTPEDITVTVNGGEPFARERVEVRYGLEERVAALEALLSPQITPAPEWTPEQVEDFKAEFARLTEIPGAHWLPPGRVLTREAVEAAVRECVTVVRPGETLVIRCRDWTVDQADQCMEYFGALADAGVIPFRPLVVVGDELAVASAEPDGDFAKRVEKVLNGLLEKEARTAKFKARFNP